MEPVVLRCHLPAAVRPGVYWPDAEPPVIFVHDDLHPHEERSVVAHELAHHRRGGGINRAWMPATWDAEVAREEWMCDRDAAALLIPPPELSRWMDENLHDWETGIGPRDVADAFGVSVRIAEAALDNLTRWERATGA